MVNKTYSILWHDCIINNQDDLEKMFKLFKRESDKADEMHYLILIELDEKLLDIITDYMWLVNCMKHLNEKNGFLFLVKIADLLPKIVTNSQLFAELLCKIPDEANKIRLIKNFRVQNLMKIMHTAHDFWNMIQWLFSDTQKIFMDFLWEENIRAIFLSTHELIIILYFLDWDNKDYLMNILGMKSMKIKIKTYKNLLDIYRSLSMKYAKKLLKLYSKEEILHFFKNDTELNYFLLRLPDNKEKLFLKFIWLQ